MVAGGLNPEWFKGMQTEILKNLAQRHNWPAYGGDEGVLQNLMRNETVKRQMEHYAALQQALQDIPRPPEYSLPPGIISSIQNAAGLLYSPEFQARLQEALQASEMAEQRFGSDGLTAAQQIAAHRLAAGPGLERGAERILNGYGDEILDEATAIASSPEARQTIERADKDALIELAQQQADQDSGAFGGEVRAGLDVETVVASVEISSEEDLRALEYFAFQLVRVLIVVVSAAVLSTGDAESLLEQASLALSGTLALLDCIKAARAKKTANG